ncbi:anthrone oxygenase family protein [Streptomyces sp. H27-D2]|uniref:anthrone oxygenase family protein n=1 Tax=Streptomyces sp. H27-D2 TaxID=3046304 RepID=UPI002DB9E9CD|nr:DUF1772 domain-containing protein [Streptomyces sp. H27-D2]MEC4019684.1 DUF1772 domain-containing protein [Streptomyces sp. H27-D2]
MHTAQGTVSHRPQATADKRSAAAGPVLVASAVGTGLIAGIYFAFDVSVLPGLDRGDDRTYVTAMQNINAEIEKGLFGLVFVGAFLATGVAAYLQQCLGRRSAARWTWGALALYTTSVILTVGVNMPINNELARAGSPETIADLGAFRGKFKGVWTASNVARTLACTAALAALGRALTLHGRGAQA